MPNVDHSKFSNDVAGPNTDTKNAHQYASRAGECSKSPIRMWTEIRHQELYNCEVAVEPRDPNSCCRTCQSNASKWKVKTD
eukprot:8619683-Pyramimonas_sp.AAC.1